MSLAETNEPLRLADGTLIDPSTGKVASNVNAMFIEIPSEKKAQQIVAKTRRTINDLPVPPKQSNTLAVIAFYSLYGFTDDQTAIALNTTKEIVERTKNTKSYKDLLQAAQDTFQHQAEDEVRALIQANAIAAASKIIEHARDGDDVLSFKASQDILDRAGHRPVDKVQIDMQSMQTLNIVYTKQEDAPELIEAEFKELEDASNS